MSTVADDFDIETRPLGGDGVVVAVSGEIDLFTAPEFKKAVTAALSTGAALLVIDLTRATFMDSSSLGVLIGAHRRLTRRRGRLVIACDQPGILKVLRVTGLDGVFEIVASTPPERDPAATR
jgi:anti-sigma B factor antagonist